MATLLECKHLCKSFDRRVVLDDVSLKIDKGKIIGLLGKNGAGKSTLIKLVNDLLTIDSGQILFKGKPIGVNSKAHISYLPERTYLDKTMTIAQAFKMFTDFYTDFDIDRARTLLEDLDLTEDMKISKMSKGMQEKLQLILVMSRDADLYILDEPLGGVDPATRDHILDTILSNFKEGSSVIISTHLISDVERILDDVIFIDKGQIVLTGAADKLRAKHKASINDIFRSMFYAKKTH
ncbi:MAG: ABC transporter ATP-binding protein [Candidatus Saccharibacteria bacterium]|nr:ABC transporter ATP-binding protein [Candidatus Saccharibacteria bacterium]